MGIRGNRNELALAIVSALALGLSACSSGGGGSSAPPLQIGGGGGGTTPTPAPTPTPTTPPGPVNAQPPIDAHLKLIGADQAKAAGYTGEGVTIGIIDTGVRRDHPTLAERVTKSFDARNAPDLFGSNPSGYDFSVDDKEGHGTTVASLAAGAAFGQWPGGVASGAKIVSWRLIADERPNDDGSGQGNELKPGFGPYLKRFNTDLAGAGARIINNSWGGLYWSNPAVTTELVDAYSDFILSRDGLIVFANGNNGDDARYRPNPSDNAALPSKSADAAVLERGWLTVAALNPTESTPTLTGYSQACGIAMKYCLTAPGNVVYTGLNDSAGNPTYYVGGGTSYAAPLVAGAAALVWSAFPYFNNDMVRQTILGTATDIGEPGVDNIFGYGLLNVAKAVRGPGKFDWGNVTFDHTGNSVWGNAISGGGGLLLNPRRDGLAVGTLTLGERSSYTGATEVNAGMLIAKGGLAASNVKIGRAGSMQALGNVGGDVGNEGTLVAGSATMAMSVSGKFEQTGDGILSLWIGNPLGVDKTASLAGTMHFAGLRNGYTASSKDVVLYTKEGVTGQFDRFSWASNLTLIDAKLAYDRLNVYLETRRIDVAAAAQNWGLAGLSQSTAQRIESAMRAIDAQLAAPSVGGIGSGFIDHMGAFQQASGVAGVDLSLRTLAGQLHGASSSLTYDSIDDSRRAAAGRFDAFQRDALVPGGWYRDLNRNGTMSQAGFDAVGYSSSGEMIGHDVRMGQNGLLGMAFSRQQQTSWLPALGDQARGYQHEGQLYAGWLRDGWYSQGRVGVGQFNRDMQRNVLLGLQLEGVTTRLSGSFLNANAETGYRFDLGGIALTPYTGLQYTHLRNDGFAEVGAAGLGLRADAWDSQRGQAYAGFRAERQWRFANGLNLGLDMRGEWQQRLLSQGDVFNASFVGIDNWQPLYGIALAERSQLYGLGLNAAWSKHLLRLDYGRRNSPLGDIGTANLLYRRSF